MRILIVRHGDPDYKNDTLTEKGHREAALLAEKLKTEKIDHIYSSHLGRAKATCEYVAKAKGMEDKVVLKPWLREFVRADSVVYPNGERKNVIWDMPPAFWTKQEEMYRADEWSKNSCFGENVYEEYKLVTRELDGLLATHGYVRNGNMYKAEKPNTDTVAIFCHFGLECILLSHLFHISPIPLLHHFVAAPTSVTTLYTEEIEKGNAVFRCCSFGDTTHLYVGNEPPSFSARHVEVYDDGLSK